MVSGDGNDEMNPAVTAWLQQPFFQITVPLIAAIRAASWVQNKRFDDWKKALDDVRTEIRDFRAEVNRRFDKVEAKLDNHDGRIVRLEERTSLVK